MPLRRCRIEDTFDSLARELTQGDSHAAHPDSPCPRLLTKAIEPAELATAVRRVAAGEAVFSPSLAGFVLGTPARLTPRERDVLRLIARGYLYKEVALELKISPRAVEHHVSAVLGKLQLTNRHQLSRWAAERRMAD